MGGLVLVVQYLALNIPLFLENAAFWYVCIIPLARRYKPVLLYQVSSQIVYEHLHDTSRLTFNSKKYPRNMGTGI